MRTLLFVLALALPLAVRSQTPETPVTPIEARHGYQTHLLRELRFGEAPETPPEGVLDLVHYPAPLGDNAAYVSPNAGDGKKHPAIIWLVGGFSNSIGDTAWAAAPKSNDQSAAGFRDHAILMMYPSLRGGNDNPGFIETFYGEVDDVLAAAKFLAARADIDPKRIYLAGHSTGGTLALLVAASAAPGQFRAVFSLGPVEDVLGYGRDVLPFDLSEPREGKLREPQRWLRPIRCPTFVFEGTSRPSNIASVRQLQARSTNPLIHFFPIEGGTHFSIIAPTVDEIARRIVADDGHAETFQYDRADGK